MGKFHTVALSVTTNCLLKYLIVVTKHLWELCYMQLNCDKTFESCATCNVKWMWTQMRSHSAMPVVTKCLWALCYMQCKIGITQCKAGLKFFHLSFWSYTKWSTLGKLHTVALSVTTNCLSRNLIVVTKHLWELC